MRFALDTNILVYAEGLDGIAYRDAAMSTIMRLPQGGIVVPVQVLGELYNVLLRKAGRSRLEARGVLLRWRQAYPVLDTTEIAIGMATDLATDNHLQIWDAVILSVASQAGCRILLSEDMHDGFTWGGVTVVNPFAEQPNPLLAALLEPPAP
jgi:predicted nucleic acid-binding protein